MPPKRKKPGRPKKVIESDGASNSSITKKTKPNGKTAVAGDFSCGICIETFNSEQEAQEHYENCVNKFKKRIVTYNCNQCTKRFGFENSYKQHLKNEHSNLPNSVACDLCPVRCPNKTILAEHIQNVHNREVFTCPNCQKTFVRRSHVKRHLEQSGCDGQGTAVFPCEICDAKFTRKDNLIVHLRLKHILKNGYKCKYCNFLSASFSKLIRHWMKTHSDTPSEYQCHHCGKSTGSRSAMTKHLEIHGERKYSCEVCGYNTFTLEVMRRHVLTHVEDKPHKCNICGQSYIQRAQLTKHLQKHTGNMCLKCGQTFTSKAKLLIHKREHMGLEKLFCPFETCIHSKKEFSNESSLENHVAVHFEVKQYPCEVCGKKFHSELTMRRHLVTHKLDRPRRCMYCVQARAYVRGERLVRHVRTHHPQLFEDHLKHVRQVLGSSVGNLSRVKKSELESVLNVMDAESDRILEGYSGADVLYGGMQDADDIPPPALEQPLIKGENSPLMSENELAENLKLMLLKLIDKDMLECFGWPDEDVDVILEKVVEHGGSRAADREKWSRVQCLRENAKHLFLYVIEDKTISRMLDTHTIDQVIKHILAQVSEGDKLT